MFQILTLEKKKEQSKIDQDEYIGINLAMDNPFQLYLKKDDFLNDRNTIHFISYSMGKKKILLWGKYMVKSMEFKYENGCKYQLKNLIPYMNSWKDRYELAYQTVTNRIRGTMDAFSGIKRFVEDYDTYVNLKYFLSSRKDSIYYKPNVNRPDNISKFEKYLKDNNEEFKILLNEQALSDEDLDYDKLIFDANPIRFLEEQLQDYEDHLNTKTHIIHLKKLKIINDMFYEFIKYGSFSNDVFYSSLKSCKSIEDCSNVYVSECDFLYDDEETKLL